MNEALEDEYLKDIYILSDLRSDRFKDMRWEVNHGVSGCRVTDIVVVISHLKELNITFYNSIFYKYNYL